MNYDEEDAPGRINEESKIAMKTRKNAQTANPAELQIHLLFTPYIQNYVRCHTNTM